MNKIVALWCHPRSMSTSVERLMRQRGDFKCLHEPFMYHYYLHQKHRDMPYFEPQAGHPVRYEDVRNMIMQMAVEKPVFFKDMAYYIDEDIVPDAEFCHSVTHCFLIRNPKAAIASYYKLDQEVTLSEIGVEALWRLYTHLVGLGIKPVVIQAESVRKNTRRAVKNWWKAIDLACVESAFEWENDHPSDWNQVRGWHESAIASTSIRPWSDNDAITESQRFDAAAEKSPHLRNYLAHHDVFYERLKRVAL